MSTDGEQYDPIEQLLDEAAGLVSPELEEELFEASLLPAGDMRRESAERAAREAGPAVGAAFARLCAEHESLRVEASGVMMPVGMGERLLEIPGAMGGAAGGAGGKVNGTRHPSVKGAGSSTGTAGTGAIGTGAAGVGRFLPRVVVSYRRVAAVLFVVAGLGLLGYQLNEAGMLPRSTPTAPRAAVRLAESALNRVGGVSEAAGAAAGIHMSVTTQAEAEGFLRERVGSSLGGLTLRPPDPLTGFTLSEVGVMDVSRVKTVYFVYVGQGMTYTVCQMRSEDVGLPTQYVPAVIKGNGKRVEVWPTCVSGATWVRVLPEGLDLPHECP